MNTNKTKDDSEDRIYKEFLFKEMKSKLVDRINNNDPQVIKTIKSLLSQKPVTIEKNANKTEKKRK